MRQAAMWIMIGVGLALGLPGRVPGGDAGAARTIAQARRLVDAKDHAAAMVLLEDLLLEADSKDKREVVDLLRQTYEAMARKAEADGRQREAAHFRDNLAIIDQGRSGKIGLPASKPNARPAAPRSSRDSALKSDPEVKNARLEAQPAGAALPARPMRAQAAPPIGPISLAPRADVPPPGPPLAEMVPPSSSTPDSAGATAGLASPPYRRDRSTGDAVNSASTSLPPPPAVVASPRDPRDQQPRPTLPAATTPAPTAAEADRLFAAKRYGEAGRIYAALARQNSLPADDVDRWAYCRCYEVARRVNLGPTSVRDWNEIEAELASIQKLAPKLWLIEYLRNKVSEVRAAGGAPPAKSDRLFVRGSAPDETQSPPRRFPRLFGRSRSDATPQQAPPATQADSASSDQPLVLAGTDSQVDSAPSQLPRGRTDSAALAANNEAPGDDLQSATPTRAQAAAITADRATATVAWQVHETSSFRIYHCDAGLAGQAGEIAESVRSAQAAQWGSTIAQRPWNPRADIYIYPSGQALAQETGQPEASPGFSTIQSNGQRVVVRRTNLRADHPQLLTAILPHEVTHVVLADLFTIQQIPRWADEGIAVLAEPPAEQELRLAELREPLKSKRFLPLSRLMAMESPDARDWSLYYAQSVALTRFLVDQGTPERFVRFVKDSSSKGIEPALRSVYRIGGFADLEERWLEHLKGKLAPLATARRDSAFQTAPAVDR